MAQPSTDTQRSGSNLSRDTAHTGSAVQSHATQPHAGHAKPAPLQVVADALGRMRYGVIQMTVHDGKLVQLDITERKRFA
ncbi:YezD family protein [Novosphingobium clariflavum]|uniref:YezD family protein n=1 Tax=Novosphingobium clariflavum TaxID=2029884 RepID=A0ABV6S4R0_9SPHN|nr:YezD family protein [Novosphingobium clariflavum]